jgi:hypothetical protein
MLAVSSAQIFIYDLSVKPPGLALSWYSLMDEQVARWRTR